jgi:DNA-binding MarR family transcriptional regulator
VDTARKQRIEALVEDFIALKRSFAKGGGEHLHRNPVTAAQWEALFAVHQRGEAPVKDIAAALGVSSSAVTQLVDGLVEGGYLERAASAEDRRAVVLSLSKKSARHFKEIKRHKVAQFLRVFAPLSDREFDHYCALTKKLVHGQQHGRRRA